MPVGEFVEEGLRLLFLSDAPLYGLIGERWYDAELAQGAFPHASSLGAITVQKVSGIPEYAHRGHEGQENARYQITIHDTCHLNCMRIAAQVRRIIKTFPRGTLPGGIRYGLMQQVNEVTMGRERGQDLFQIAIDIRITHQVYL